MDQVYLYGMVLVTNSFLLKKDYPAADSYGEIREKYALPGGETGTCATVLASLGCRVKLDGTWMGKKTAPVLRSFYDGKAVDLSSMMVDESFGGVEDYVFIDRNTRTSFGTFETYFSDSAKRWNRAEREDIEAADAVGLDPFFGEQSEAAARLCVEIGRPFVTIDCPYDSVMHRLCSVNALSGEFLRNTYPGANEEELFHSYAQNTNGLTIFTHGSRGMFYGRKDTPMKKMPAFRISPVSTLGAGDTFKAGCVYGLLKRMDDESLVRFASAAAAVACMAFPLPLNPPTLEQIEVMQRRPVGGTLF